MRFFATVVIATGLLFSSCSSSQQLERTGMATPDGEAETNWTPADGPLMTKWASEVNPEEPLPKYPRPQMTREEWENLNGLWDYSINERNDGKPARWEGEILVPFAIESALSGVKRRVEADQELWYRRAFTLPDGWNEEQILLHFGAVDWESTVFVNGKEMGTHKGGYDSFTYNITDALKPTGRQEIVVRVYDPTDDGNQPRGKQVKEPGGIWYTPVTGIWQTVWMEPVNRTHIETLDLTPDIDQNKLDLTVNTEGTDTGMSVVVTAYKEGVQVSREVEQTGRKLSLPIPEPRLWSPDDPFLYDLTVSLREDGRVVDEVESYFGMRKIEVGKDEEGTPRILLNNEFVFQLGPLDQGYWPDGLYTAPTDEALHYDLEMTRKLGFNMNRKHVKVEPDRWYYWADRLGVLVWQDMVTGDNATPASRDQFEEELNEMVTQFDNHPSIVHWIVFNEGWGQFDTRELTRKVQEWDSSRIVTDASGWQHMGGGDVIDVHRYPGPVAIKPKRGRASVVGEFGGVGYVIKDHTWTGEGWGYQNVIDRPEPFINRYEELIKRMWWLSESADMSGGVYTQLTDLETEINGMITYDRALAKASPERFASVNRGRTPLIRPLERRFVDTVTVTLHNWEDGSVIRYTLNGSEPTVSSPRYESPLRLTGPATVRARTFAEGEPLGHPAVAEYRQVEGREPVAETPDNLEKGLQYRYYESPANDRPRFKQHWPLRQQLGAGNAVEPAKSGTIGNFDLSPAEQDRIFAFEYEGFIEVPRTGVYTFYIGADDDAKIYIGDTQISDRLGQSPDRAHDAARVPLKAGLHPVTLKYFQAYGPFGLDVAFEGPGFGKKGIPDDVLYHAGR